MNWIKQNKFLAGFLAVLIVGVGALCALFYASYGTFSEASENFTNQVQELGRLKRLVPYPNDENLKKTAQEKAAYVEESAKLAQDLAALQLPIVPMSPVEFQDKLRKTVSSVVDQAGRNGVKLPTKFYLGFDVYQASPPKDSASAPLGRELNAIEMVANILIQEKVDAIVDIKRSSLPEEGEVKAVAGRREPVAKQELVVKHPFEIGFVADQSRFRKALNEITGSKQQFFIVRSLVVKNEREKGPARAPASVTTSATTAQTGDSTAAKDEGIKYDFVVGTEKLKVAMVIEMVDFTPAAKK